MQAEDAYAVDSAREQLYPEYAGANSWRIPLARVSERAGREVQKEAVFDFSMYTAGGVVMSKMASLAKSPVQRIIALGLDKEGDLARAEASGAISYLKGGWQKAGLTTVKEVRRLFDSTWRDIAFKEAARNADAIHFDVTNFSPNIGGATQAEFRHIINTPALLPKTTFMINGERRIWNGTSFVKP